MHDILRIDILAEDPERVAVERTFHLAGELLERARVATSRALDEDGARFPGRMLHHRELARSRWFR